MPVDFPLFRVKPVNNAAALYAARLQYIDLTGYLFDELAIGGAGNFIDLWNHVPLYGKLTPQNLLVVPRENKMEYSLGTSMVGAFPWMYEAISDLQSYFNRAAVHGRTDLTKLYDAFTVRRSYISPYRDYLAYAASFLIEFHRTLVRGNRCIVSDFKNYLKAFVAYSDQREEPFTFGNYYASSRVSAHSTGLVISFADHNANHSRHTNQYFQNEEFGKLVQGAANFGFRVDQHAPWRFVADLASEPMTKYLLRQDIPDLNALFKTYYTPAITYELTTTRALLLKGYDQYQTNRKFGVKNISFTRATYDFKSAIMADSTPVRQAKVPIQRLAESLPDEKYSLEAFIPILEAIKKSETRGRIDQLAYKSFYAAFRRYWKAGRHGEALHVLTRFYNLN